MLDPLNNNEIWILKQKREIFPSPHASSNQSGTFFKNKTEVLRQASSPHFTDEKISLLPINLCDVNIENNG